METDDTFARLIRPLERRMIDIVWKVLRHPHDAEDALQNALATVWQERLRIECHPAPQALVLKICTDAAIDQFRRRRTRRIERGADALEECASSASPSPLDDAIDKETADIVVEALTRLSQNQAIALVMRFFQREPDETIAAALGCGTETVREHLARGKERLSRMLRALAPRGNEPPATTRTTLQKENE